MCFLFKYYTQSVNIKCTQEYLLLNRNKITNERFIFTGQNIPFNVKKRKTFQ